MSKFSLIFTSFCDILVSKKEEITQSLVKIVQSCFDRSKKIDMFSLFLHIVIVVAIALFGMFLLGVAKTEHEIIMHPSNDISYVEQAEQKKDESHLININTASKEELMLLAGIGEKKAENIIAYREKTPFTCPEDIVKVEGIGNHTYEKFADKICVE